MATLRRYVVPLAIIGALIVFYIEAPWSQLGLSGLTPSSDVSTALAFIFWIIAIVVVVTLFQDRHQPGAEVVEVEGPAFTRYLFHNTRAGVFWLPIRLFVGFSFLEAGLGKFQGKGWLDGGSALLGFWKGAAAIPPTGHPPISFEWYRDFINVLINNNAQGWFAYLIVFGELAVGLGLVFGVLTGFASFFGALMNMSFLLAGSASTNPVLFTCEIGIILGWRVAGYYGLDRYLFPRIGVPWRTTSASAPAPAGPVTAPMAS
ncbi:MAG TPA: DoxX family membrane protein [Candidatus Limnocylindrales bacterium]|nr:DoxX family membrane protein [Candidatus Limnocylindrales bacterium]